MPKTGKAVSPLQRASSAEYFPRITGGLTILIWSENKGAADEIDGALRDLLTAYEYDPSAPESRITFEGSFFIRYSFKRKSPDLEEDIQLEFSDEPLRRKPIPAKKRSLISRLKKILERSQGIIVVAGLLFANAGALKEAQEQFLKLFEAPPPPKTLVSYEMPPGALQPPKPQAGEEPQVISITIPPALAIAMENAEKNPKDFELLLKFVAADYHEQPRHRTHRHHRKNPKPPNPSSPSPQSNRGTL